HHISPEMRKEARVLILSPDGFERIKPLAALEEDIQWDSHVIVELAGRIYDFDFQGKPGVPIDDYFRQMFGGKKAHLVVASFSADDYAAYSPDEVTEGAFIREASRRGEPLEVYLEKQKQRFGSQTEFSDLETRMESHERVSATIELAWHDSGPHITYNGGRGFTPSIFAAVLKKWLASQPPEALNSHREWEISIWLPLDRRVPLDDVTALLPSVLEKFPSVEKIELHLWNGHHVQKKKVGVRVSSALGRFPDEADPLAFFRADVPQELREEIIAELLADDSLFNAFGSDVAGYVRRGKMEFDWKDHLPRHLFTFNQLFGVPAFDLGLAFWLGANMKTVQRFLSRRKADTPVKSAHPDQVAEQWQATLAFMDLLQTLRRDEPIPELIQKNPQPGAQSYAESRYSFFRTFLPFYREGDTLNDTYERRTRFWVRVAKMKYERTTSPKERLLVANWLPPFHEMGLTEFAAKWVTERKFAAEMRSARGSLLESDRRGLRVDRIVPGTHAGLGSGNGNGGLTAGSEGTLSAGSPKPSKRPDHRRRRPLGLAGDVSLREPALRSHRLSHLVRGRVR
ncbi:MAG: hypothetical protein Q7T11_09595, partial [Deltaproteobacteria bacterium]|nr:hypothetical protein [Deltaproteobacteria bacterium]